jgi:hypothetical protein
VILHPNRGVRFESKSIFALFVGRPPLLKVQNSGYQKFVSPRSINPGQNKERITLCIKEDNSLGINDIWSTLQARLTALHDQEPIESSIP